ncbi:MAG: hypothetical protein ACLQE9_22750 [Roseiarcus sp.]
MSHSNPGDEVRFRLTRLQDGRWLVLDEGCWKRVVASCPQERDAQAIVALMNGDAEGARSIHTEFLADENLLQFEMA